MIALSVIASVACTTLSAGAQTPTALVVSVKPASAVIYVDGARRGTAAHQRTLHLSPGIHVVRVVNGKDEHQETVNVLRGKKTQWTWEFEDDRTPTTTSTESTASPTTPMPPAVRSDKHRVAAAQELVDVDLRPRPDTEERAVSPRCRAAADLLAAMPVLSPQKVSEASHTTTRTHRRVQKAKHRAS